MDPARVARRLNAVQRDLLLLVAQPDNGAVRGNLWLQKEVFLVSRSVPDLAAGANFEPSLMGPFSDAVEWNADQLVRSGFLKRIGATYELTSEGRAVAEILEADAPAERIKLLSDTKKLLNDLSTDELLAFVYFLYPGMTEESEKLEGLLPKRKEIAVRLFQRGKVSSEVGAKVAGTDQSEFLRLLRSRGVPVYSQ